MLNRTDSQDALSTVLDVFDVHCSISGRLVAGGSWRHRFANVASVKFFAVTQGRCQYFLDDEPTPTDLNPGDVLVTNGEHTLTLGSSAVVEGTESCGAIAKDEAGLYRLGMGDDLTMLAGVVAVSPELQPLLLSCLPPKIHLRVNTFTSSSISRLLELLIIEMDEPISPGRALTLASLAKLIFVQTLRAYLRTSEECSTGWLKGFVDKRLSVALQCMHSEPAAQWTIDAMAKQACMSRTTFARRFCDVMGMAPLAYLTQWRIHMAKRQLNKGATVAQAASEAGYESESAFSSAFRRITGMSPGSVGRESRRLKRNVGELG